MQWADELALHSPGLKVLVYEGWTKTLSMLRKKEEEDSGSTQKGQTRNVSKSRPTARKVARRFLKMGSEDSDYGPSQSASRGSVTPSVASSDGQSQPDFASYINDFDVCITTYPTLAADFNVARAPPVRPRREDVVYANVVRPRSPLVTCEWWRVIMDEVQMVGGGNTEYVSIDSDPTILSDYKTLQEDGFSYPSYILTCSIRDSCACFRCRLDTST